MDIEKRKQFPVFGIFLILIGFGILFDRMNLFDFTWKKIWPIGLGLIGIWMTISAILYNQRGKVFGGSFIFLFGILYFLKNYDFISLRQDIFLPALLLILGLSFFMLFVFEPRDWGVLIPSIIFIGLGLFITFTRLGYIFYYELWDFVAIYWPLLLIIIGISMLISGKGRKISE
jgi:hypothetical protein